MLACGVGAEKPKEPTDPNEPWDTNAMVYVPGTAIGELASIAAEFRAELSGAKDGRSIKPKDKGVLPADRIDARLRSRNGVINLFGRMLAEIDDAKVDGAAQVAHAFTTHATDTEIDIMRVVQDDTGVDAVVEAPGGGEQRVAISTAALSCLLLAPAPPSPPAP
ncbi:type I-E CRISPR-associated protein Cas7/Cse4/CasC [Embleya sp. NPDC005575]|uniref:type I-E CRISPR-associated protein Cas7/Cse4/CasC n=1 Tax=Embleya sp. NPDC005575 TaxID=3156892 RepID=UPI0033B8FAFD